MTTAGVKWFSPLQFQSHSHNSRFWWTILTEHCLTTGKINQSSSGSPKVMSRIHSFIHSFIRLFLFYKRHDRTQANKQCKTVDNIIQKLRNTKTNSSFVISIRVRKLVRKTGGVSRELKGVCSPSEVVSL